MNRNAAQKSSAQDLIEEVQKELAETDTRKLYRLSAEEAQIVKDLVFKTDNKPGVLKVLDRVLSSGVEPNMHYNGSTIRRCWFLNELLGSACGNAAQAARASGFSSRGAKQQGYRLMREFRKAYE